MVALDWAGQWRRLESPERKEMTPFPIIDG